MIPLVVLLLLAFDALAQVAPGTIGQAGVNDLAHKTGSVLRWNPAVLATPQRFKSSLEFISLTAAATNNAFSVRFWNNHLAGDHFFSEEAKNEILGRIPDDGWAADLQLGVPLLGFTYDRYGLCVALESDVRASLPKDLAKLVVEGNELNRRYGITDLYTEGQVLVDYGAGFGYTFDQDYVPALRLGIGIHYYQGLFMFKAADKEGGWTVTDSTLSGASFVNVVHAERGDGVGFDLGATADLTDRWQVGFAIRQLGARLTWAIDENQLISFYSDSAGIIIDSLDDDGYVDRAFHYEDTTFSGGLEQTRLPVLLHLNGRYAINRKLIGLGEMLLRTGNSSQGKAGVEIGIAANYLPLRWLLLEGGIGVGGSWRSRFGVGGGLRFRNYELDLGWTWIGGLFNSTHGIGVGLSQRVMF